MPDSGPNMVALVEILAKAVVQTPEEVSVEPFEENGQTVLELVVAESDLGRVIGRQGRTARSLRTNCPPRQPAYPQALPVGDSGIVGEFITIARVLGPQGRRGEVLAE